MEFFFFFCGISYPQHPSQSVKRVQEEQKSRPRSRKVFINTFYGIRREEEEEKNQKTKEEEEVFHLMVYGMSI